jgi:hypothetical protein
MTGIYLLWSLVYLIIKIRVSVKIFNLRLQATFTSFICIASLPFKLAFIQVTLFAVFNFYTIFLHCNVKTRIPNAFIVALSIHFGIDYRCNGP